MTTDADTIPDISDVAYQREFIERHRLASAQVPRRFRHKRLEGFHADTPERARLLAAANAYVERFRLDPDSDPGLFFSGTPGSGKSHLAVGILIALIARGVDGMFVNAPDLLAEIRASFDEGAARSEIEIMDEVARVDVLVLDDLGAEKTTDFVLDRFYQVVNRRYQSCLPTIVTTNLDLAGMDEKLGSRITSRLCEMCKIVTAFPTEDYRRRMAKEMK